MVRNEGNKKTKIVDNGHELFGKHVISLTVPLALEDASKIAECFNLMPSNSDKDMFAVKLVSEHKSNEKNYMVVIKLCIGDSVDFIDYPNE